MRLANGYRLKLPPITLRYEQRKRNIEKRKTTNR